MNLHRISAICCCLLAHSVIAFAVAGQVAQAAEKSDSAIQATVGKGFTISLESNRSTGFGWQLAKPLDETLVKSVKNEYQDAPEAPGKERVVGVPGKEVWTFKALKSGKITIEFKYVRPWEKDKAPAKTQSVTVEVKEAK
jgi:inhibitor of cysteine peptidase